MKKRLLLISDYVEGLPVVASVRYEQIARRLSEKYEIVLVHNSFYGEGSVYAAKSFSYSSISSRYTNDFKGEVKRATGLEFFLRKSGLVKKIWKGYKKSRLVFDRKNKAAYVEIGRYLSQNPVDLIFATVPELEVVYVAQAIKREIGKIPIVTEVRDIIDSEIWTDIPAGIKRGAEKGLCKLSDAMIVLSRGIKEHYEPMLNRGCAIEIIKNGYETGEFEGRCREFDAKGILNRGELRLAHIGSIYEGRNVGDLLRGLLIFARSSTVDVSISLIGHIDDAGMREIRDFEIENRGVVNVDIAGSMPHEKAVERLLKCDVAAVVTHKRGSSYAIPGKVFEYIGACKPILAVSTDGELIELVDGKYGECASHNPNAVSAKIEKMLKSSYDFSKREEFSRRAQVDSIIRFLQKIEGDAG